MEIVVRSYKNLIRNTLISYKIKNSCEVILSSCENLI